MLELVQVSKQFGLGGRAKTAVQEVSLTLQRDEIFALVGESGSGKSTLAEIMIGLQQPTSGSVAWHEESGLESGQKRRRLKGMMPPGKVQMIFQNPDRSLNPYWKVKDIVSEPLILHQVSRAEAGKIAADLLERVKLPSSLMERNPSECSGGQKQRIAIARALTMAPSLLIADEITSALDPSTEDEILNLLRSLKKEHHMTILYITHRLETIRGFADRMAVMQAGAIVEEGAVEQVLSAPRCSYTRALIEACFYV
ncbi:dipeptide/oligopeptide/nickel ABC transporter ATP-binding protein [Paenibacillus sp. D2_2]|uniref:ABC transporter ATP-binding protein n=1 Tax=Paenibacillus sp. D2_2 TaxID=3073092 RepID=UPI00281687CC|nr:dipeptide/oligopeptide/nickel ABC transporter ATP-binding protein [Paenibacillus sp. D2_2]WMT40364.1 dipeptide/oligopeptide/nickel ABC transporter ATP-binding protein [Paenibacillus sp. D2_2]